MEIIDPAPVKPPLPTVSSCYSHSWESMKRKFPELLLTVLLVIAINIPVAIIMSLFENAGPFGIAITAMLGIGYGVFIAGPLDYGVAWVFLRAARGEHVEIKNIFDPFNNYANVIIAAILTSIMIGIGFFLLIIPGIVLSCKLAFVPFLVMDKKMEAIEAIRKSWEMTNGHAITIFFMGLLAIPIVLVGLILLFVGVIPASMWIEGAMASIYYSVDSSWQESQQAMASQQ